MWSVSLNRWRSYCFYIGETVNRIRKSYESAKMVRTSFITMASTVGSGVARRQGRKRSMFSVCLPSRFWMVKIVVTISPWSRSNLEAVWWRRIGNVCSCAPAFKFVSAPLVGVITECRIWKWVKVGGFSPQWQHDEPIRIKCSVHSIGSLFHAKFLRDQWRSVVDRNPKIQNLEYVDMISCRFYNDLALLTNGRFTNVLRCYYSEV